MFAQKPPPGNAQRHPPILKEWGAEIDSDEIYDTSELEEFISTDLVYLELPIKRTNLGSINDEPPPKRRKLDTASLRNVIPQVASIFMLYTQLSCSLESATHISIQGIYNQCVLCSTIFQN